HEDANIIWGAAFDESMEDEMTVTVIATGFASHNGNVAEEKPAAAPAPAEAPVPPVTHTGSTAPGTPRAGAPGREPRAPRPDDGYGDRHGFCLPQRQCGRGDARCRPCAGRSAGSPGEPYRQNRPRHPWGSRSGPGARSPHPGG